MPTIDWTITAMDSSRCIFPCLARYFLAEGLNVEIHTARMHSSNLAMRQSMSQMLAEKKESYFPAKAKSTESSISELERTTRGGLPRTSKSRSIRPRSRFNASEKTPLEKRSRVTSQFSSS